MECLAMDQRREVRIGFFARSLKLVAATLGKTDRPYNRIDPETMSEYMKRDLGFLDGREPRCERDVPW